MLMMILSLFNEIKIDHLCFHNGSREQDSISLNVEKISKEEGMHHPKSFTDRDYAILSEYISKY